MFTNFLLTDNEIDSVKLYTARLIKKDNRAKFRKSQNAINQQ